MFTDLDPPIPCVHAQRLRSPLPLSPLARPPTTDLRRAILIGASILDETDEYRRHGEVEDVQERRGHKVTQQKHAHKRHGVRGEGA